MCSTREFFDSKRESLEEAYLITIQIVATLSRLDRWYDGEDAEFFDSLLEVYIKAPLDLGPTLTGALKDADIKVSPESRTMIIENVLEGYDLLSRMESNEAEEQMHVAQCMACINDCYIQ